MNKEINQEQKITDRSFEPRGFNRDYNDGKLTAVEWIVLVWIWKDANPFTGISHISYPGLASESPAKATPQYTRKILTNLRKKRYLYFSNHSGKGGAFAVYPVGYLRADKKIQTWEFLKNRAQRTAQSQVDTTPDTNHEDNHKYNIDGQIHRFNEGKTQLIHKFSMVNNDHKFTGSYTNNDTENINSRSSYKRIDIRSFLPKTYEEERCKEIATALGETDMRFILSCLKKHGFGAVENAWATLNEIKSSGKHIENQGAYFNRIIKKK
jgi:hypothetical protein